MSKATNKNFCSMGAMDNAVTELLKTHQGRNPIIGSSAAAVAVFFAQAVLGRAHNQQHAYESLLKGSDTAIHCEYGTIGLRMSPDKTHCEISLADEEYLPLSVHEFDLGDVAVSFTPNTHNIYVSSCKKVVISVLLNSETKAFLRHLRDAKQTTMPIALAVYLSSGLNTAARLDREHRAFRNIFFDLEAAASACFARKDNVFAKACRDLGLFVKEEITEEANEYSFERAWDSSAEDNFANEFAA